MIDIPVSSLILVEPKVLISPTAWAGHLPFLYWLTVQQKPKVAVELGTYTGNGYFAICQAIDEGVDSAAECFAVSDWKSAESLDYELVDANGLFAEKDVFNQFNFYNHKYYRHFSSVKKTSPEKAVNDFQEASIDLLVFDSFYSNENLTELFQSWMPKLSERGIVLFHGIESNPGVKQFWSELESSHPSFSFRHSSGLGVLCIGKEVSETLVDFCQQPNKEKSRHLFEKLGEGTYFKARHKKLEKNSKVLCRLFLENHENALEQKRNIADIHASTSWRLSAPVRWVGSTRSLGKSELLRKMVGQGISDVFTSARNFDVQGFIKAGQRFENSLDDCRDIQGKWLKLKKRTEALRPQEEAFIDLMPDRPLLSVIAYVRNTPTAYLQAMLNSVRAQSYTDWELCIVNDGSFLSSIRDVLDEFSGMDAKINIFNLNEPCGLGKSVGNVLDRLSGDYAVFVNDGDMLEANALARVARCIAKESPDFIYFDEVMVSANGIEAIDFAFKPGFSLEYLRGKSYVGSSIAVETKLLQQIGEMDEWIPGAYFYELVLRLAENSRKIVHIPEILYRNRVYASNGVKQMAIEIVKKSIRDTRKYEQAYGPALVLEDIRKVLAIIGKAYSGRRKILHTDKNELTDKDRLTAQLEAVRGHLQRCDEKAQVSDGGEDSHDVRYETDFAGKVAIIIPTKNCGELVRQCIDSIGQTVEKVAYEIVLINHDSDDPASIEYFNSIRNQHRVFDYSGVFNFSAINNWAVKQIENQGFTHYLFCNNDIEAVSGDWLERMFELADKPDIGMVGAKLLYPERNEIQHAGVTLGLMGLAEHNGKFCPAYRNDETPEAGYNGLLNTNHELSAVTAACILMRREVFQEVDGYDEIFAVGFGDVDLCLRIRQMGYRVVLSARSVLIHHESYTRGSSSGKEDSHPLDTSYFVDRWNELLELGDPFYNPNFDLCSHSWEYDSFLPVSFEPVFRITHLNPVKHKA